MSVFVLGSLNVDMAVRTETSPKPGQTVEGSSFSLGCGGKGANQAVAIKRLSGNVILSGCLGNDANGLFYRQNLEKEGLDDEAVKSVSESTGVAFIIVEGNGQNRIVIVHGANYCFEPADVRSFEKQIEEANVCLAQLENRTDTIEEFASLARKHNKTFILNPAPAKPLSDGLLKNVSILTPNENELGILTGINPSSQEKVLEACDCLHKRGVDTVIVTLGGKGCFLSTPNSKSHIAGYRVKVVDTTGAGDSFNGALAYMLDEGRSINEACEFANKVGALTVTKAGALSSLPTLKEVKAFPFQN